MILDGTIGFEGSWTDLVVQDFQWMKMYRADAPDEHPDDHDGLVAWLKYVAQDLRSFHVHLKKA